MSYATAHIGAPPAPIATPADLFEGETMLDPKWAVLAVVMTAFGLAVSYDARLGFAAGTVVGAMTLIYLWMRYTFATDAMEPGANRGALSQRVDRLERNRREAEEKETERVGSGAQGRAEPRQRS